MSGSTSQMYPSIYRVTLTFVLVVRAILTFSSNQTAPDRIPNLLCCHPNLLPLCRGLLSCRGRLPPAPNCPAIGVVWHPSFVRPPPLAIPSLLIARQSASSSNCQSLPMGRGGAAPWSGNIAGSSHEAKMI